MSFRIKTINNFNASTATDTAQNESTVTNTGAGTDNAVPRFDTIGNVIQDSGVIIDDLNNITGVNDLAVINNLTVNGIDITAQNTSAVIGPATSTDNALVRFDETTGKLVKNSGVIIDDLNNITGVNDLAVINNLTVNGIDITAQNTSAVIGPATSTDNALVRFDGTTGKLVKNSTTTLTDTGDLQIAGYMLAADGDATNPAYTFINDSGTGLFNGGSNIMGFTSGGGLKMSVQPTTVEATVPLRLPNGTVNNPSYSFSTASSSGMYYNGAGISLGVSSTEAIDIRSNSVTSIVPFINNSTSTLTGNITTGGSIDKTTASALSIGGTTASAIDISKPGAITTVKGDLVIAGNLNITTGAFIPAQLTIAQRNTITTIGAIVYDTELSSLMVYTGDANSPWNYISTTSGPLRYVSPFNLTSDTSNPTFQTSASSYLNQSLYPAWKIQDGIFPNSVWACGDNNYNTGTGLATGPDTFNGENGSWIKIDLVTPAIVNRYSFSYNGGAAAIQRPMQWKVYTSMDDATWTLEHHQSADFSWVDGPDALFTYINFPERVTRFVVIHVLKKVAGQQPAYTHIGEVEISGWG